MIACAGEGHAVHDEPDEMQPKGSLAHHVGRVDADRDSAAVGLITRHTLDVDAELAAVNREHLALSALEESTDLTRDTCT